MSARLLLLSIQSEMWSVCKSKPRPKREAIAGFAVGRLVLHLIASNASLRVPTPGFVEASKGSSSQDRNHGGLCSWIILHVHLDHPCSTDSRENWFETTKSILVGGVGDGRSRHRSINPLTVLFSTMSDLTGGLPAIMVACLPTFGILMPASKGSKACCSRPNARPNLEQHRISSQDANALTNCTAWLSKTAIRTSKSEPSNESRTLDGIILTTNIDCSIDPDPAHESERVTRGGFERCWEEGRG